MEYTLANAAKEAGCSKSKVFRAFKSGRLAGRRDNQGTIWIERSEMDRWNSDAQQTRGDDAPRHDVVTQEDAPAVPAETAAELASLRAENALLRDALQRERDRADRDHEALMLGLRSLPPPDTPAPVTERPRRRWPWQR